MIAMLVAVYVLAQTPAPAPAPEKFTAIIGVQATTERPTAVDIGIDRWATDDQRARLINELRAGGQPGLAAALRKEGLAGYLYMSGRERLECGYATQETMPDASRRILLLCVRKPGPWEVASPGGARTEYLFRILALKVDAKGRGEGLLYPAVSVDITSDGVKVLDELTGQPTRLMSLRKTK